MSDGNDGTNTSTLTLTMVPVNDPPAATDDTFTMPEDGTPVIIPVLGNDSDPDGDPLTVTQIDGQSPTVGLPITLRDGSGTVTLNPDGTITFTPAPNYNGSPVFTYTVKDPSGVTSTATVRGTVTPVNDAPVDGDESITTPEDTPATGNVLANSTDVDGGTPTVSSFTVNGQALTAGQTATIPNVGALVINQDGSYTFTPAANYSGPVPVATYTVSDGNGGTDTSTLTIAITPVNDAPVDGDETHTVTEDTTLSVPAAGGLLVNTTDVDVGAPSVTQFVVNGTTVPVPAGGNGSATIVGVGTITIGSDGSYSFAPVTNYMGAIPAITYTVSDGVGGTDTSTLTLTMVPVNDAPVDGDESVTTPEDTPATGNVLTNSTDVDGGTPTVTQFTVGGQTLTAGQAATLPGVGTLVINADGSYTFTPAANYNGPVPVATYAVSDGNGGTDTSTLTISVTPVNDPPAATDDIFTMPEDGMPVIIPVLGNDNDPDGDPLTVTQIDGQSPTVGQPVTLSDGSGTATLNPDGTITFTPAPNYNGSPVFTYTVTDPSGATSTGTVRGTVTPVNDAPVDGNESKTIAEDTTLSVPAATGLLANTTDVDGGTPTVTQFVVNGTTVNVPASGNGSTTIAGVGMITIGSDGSYSFTPEPNWNGTVPVVTYTVSDGAGGTDTSTLAITATPVNDAPVDGDESVNTPEDMPATGNVLINAVDPEGNPLTMAQFTVGGQTLTAGQTATLPGVGTLTIGANGDFTFTPAPNYAGPVPGVTYTVADGNGGTDTSTLTIAITPVNDAPVDGDESITTPEDTPATGNVLTNAADLEGNPLTVTEFTVGGQTLTAGQTATIPNVGTLAINADGSYSFIPAPNYSGPVPVATYTVSDGQGGTDTSALTISVTPVNDVPVDGDETNTVTEDTTLTVPASSGLLANTTDVDGGIPSVTQFVVNGTTVTVPAGGNGSTTIAGVGTLTVGSDGSYSFAPAPNYMGAIPLVTYTLSDGNGGSDTSTLTLAMVPVNDAPVDADELVSTPEDRPATGNVLVNATDPEGNPLTVTEFTVGGQTLAAGQTTTIPNVGTLVINTDGSYTFTPAANYSGPVPVAIYTVSDGQGGTDTSTLTIAIIPVNDLPVDGDEAVTTPEDTPATGNVLTNSTDVDGGTPTVTQFSVGGQTLTAGQTATLLGVGTLTIGANGDFTFTPEPNYSGPVPVATYTVSDGNGGTDTSTLTITITSVNDAPVDDDETSTVTEDTTLTVPAGNGLLANTTDVDGGTPSVTQFVVNGMTVTVPTGGNGVTTIVGVGTLTIGSDGSYSFAPVTNYTGVIPVVTYTVSDGNGGSDTSTLTLTMAPVNDPPVATDDTFTMPEDGAPVKIPVLGNDSDPDGDPLTVTQIDGQIPVAGQPVTLSDGSGTATLNPDGTITFTPAPNYNGSPVFTYTVKDPSGVTSTATVRGTVTPVNDAPVDGDESITTPEDTPATGNVLANSTDVDGGTPTVTNFTLDIGGTPTTFTAGQTATIPNVGTLVINQDGSYTFTPVANYNGPVPVATYTVSDGQGRTDTSTLTIAITPVNDPPAYPVPPLPAPEPGADIETLIQGGRVAWPQGQQGLPIDELRKDALRQIYVPPYLNAAANNIRSLSGVTSLGVPQPVLAAVNGIRSLDGQPDLDVNAPILDLVEHLQGRFQLLDPTKALFRPEFCGEMADVLRGGNLLVAVEQSGSTEGERNNGKANAKEEKPDSKTSKAISPRVATFSEQVMYQAGVAGGEFADLAAALASLSPRQQQPQVLSEGG